MSLDLNNLLEKKSFDELTPNERSFVLERLSEMEYNWQREVILSAKSYLAEKPTISPLKPTAALQALEKQKARPAPVLSIHKIPTWMAVAACVLVFFLAKGTGIAPAEKDTTLCQEVVDTVFVDRLVRYISPANEQPPERSYIAANNTPKKQLNESVEKQPETKSEPLFSADMISVGNINYDNYFSKYSRPSGVSLQNDSITKMVNAVIF